MKIYLHIFCKNSKINGFYCEIFIIRFRKKNIFLLCTGVISRQKIPISALLWGGLQ